MEFDHKLVESTEDGDLVLALNADSWLKENNRHKKETTRGADASNQYQTAAEERSLESLETQTVKI